MTEQNSSILAGSTEDEFKAADEICALILDAVRRYAPARLAQRIYDDILAMIEPAIEALDRGEQLFPRREGTSQASHEGRLEALWLIGAAWRMRSLRPDVEGRLVPLAQERLIEAFCPVD